MGIETEDSDEDVNHVLKLLVPQLDEVVLRERESSLGLVVAQ